SPLVTSAGVKLAAWPIPFATSAPAEAGRSSRATREPAATSRSAVERPRPEAPPVTTAFTARSSMEPPRPRILADPSFEPEPHYLVAALQRAPTSSGLSDTHHLISFLGMERVAAARGEITEIVGRPSSGRTSLLVACLRDVAQSGETAALVDTEETFDPASAAQAGVDLRRLLWVRCGGRRDVALVAGVSRFACVLVAHFAAAAVERCEPALREQPLAVLTQTANIKILVDANAAARERDVRSGMTETEAAARCPTLVTRSHIEE